MDRNSRSYTMDSRYEEAYAELKRLSNTTGVSLDEIDAPVLQQSLSDPSGDVEDVTEIDRVTMHDIEVMIVSVDVPDVDSAMMLMNRTKVFNAAMEMHRRGDVFDDLLVSADALISSVCDGERGITASHAALAIMDLIDMRLLQQRGSRFVRINPIAAASVNMADAGREG